MNEAIRGSGWTPVNWAIATPSRKPTTWGEALDPVPRRELLVGVHIDLGEQDPSLLGGHGPLEQRGQLAARSAPGSPEVHDHRSVVGRGEDLLLEIRGVDVDDQGRGGCGL